MRHWIVTICFALVLTGCGSKWLYDNSDWFAAQYLDNYIELNDPQRAFLRHTVRMSVPWHRTNELPLYIDHIDDIDSIDPKTFSVADYREQQQRFQQHSLRVYEYFSTQIVTLISRLDDDQAEQFMDYLRVKHVKRKQRYQNYDEQQFRQRFQTKMTETLEKWMGPLNEKQTVLVADWAQQRNVTLPLWFDYQTRLRIEVDQLLKKRSDQALIKSALDSFVYNPQQFYSQQLQRLVEQNSQLGEEYLVAIINQMSASQNRHLENELDYWRDVMQDLK